MKCNIKYDINYIIILFTIFFSVVILKKEWEIKINKLIEMLFLFLVTVIYNINDYLSYSMIFLYLLYKLNEANI